MLEHGSRPLQLILSRQASAAAEERGFMNDQRQVYGCSITAPLLSSSKWPSPKAHFSSTPPFSRRIRRNYTPVYWGAREWVCLRRGL